MSCIKNPDVSIIITCHREGIITAVTGKSALATAAYAAETSGITCEFIAIFDRTDAITKNSLVSILPENSIISDVDLGDPALARNHGIELASGTCAAFLDGDDLWSENWIANAWHYSKKHPNAVLQSDCNVVFGETSNIWWHVDSENALFDPNYLPWTNYWDAMSFAPTEIYRKYPFKKNDLILKFGHEDWHWSCLTYENGIPHKPVPETIHFKRRRVGSQMSLVSNSKSVMWPLNAGPLAI